MGNVYIRSQLSIKREMSNAKAPVLGAFGSAISGLSKLILNDYVSLSRLTMLDSVD